MRSRVRSQRAINDRDGVCKMGRRWRVAVAALPFRLQPFRPVKGKEGMGQTDGPPLARCTSQPARHSVTVALAAAPNTTGGLRPRATLGPSRSMAQLGSAYGAHAPVRGGPQDCARHSPHSLPELEVTQILTNNYGY